MSFLLHLPYQEAVVGKCNVVCTSRDRRNPQLTEAEVRMAEYFFYRTFDVGSCKISNCFIDRIDGIRGMWFSNYTYDFRSYMVFYSLKLTFSY